MYADIIAVNAAKILGLLELEGLTLTSNDNSTVTARTYTEQVRHRIRTGVTPAYDYRLSTWLLTH